VIPPERGIIMDRNGKALAEDGAAYDIILHPQVLKKKGLEREAARGLASILATGSDPGEVGKLETKFFEMATRKRPNSDQLLVDVEVQREGMKVDGETKMKVEQLIKELQDKLKLRNEEAGTKVDTKNVGIGIRETEKRYYPFNRLASHVLGYIDRDGKPNYGLESMLDEKLKGTPGKLVRESDLLGVELPNGKMSYTPPVDGMNVRLTLDRNIQYYLENALQKAYTQWNPRSIFAIAADPKTMEILGMANMPDFNPNKYWEVKDVSAFRNNAVSFSFEPGSIFKAVTLAGAIEEGVFKPGDTYQSGSIKVPGKTIYDHNISGWGKISYMEGLLRSSNVAFVKLGMEKLGIEKLQSYIDRFGFGVKTNIDLPGEAAGIVRMNPRVPVEYATSTYGQGLTVTAIQQAAAYGAIANGGKLMKPYIVKEIIDPHTKEAVQSNSPEVVRQAISEATAKEAALALEQVVANQEAGTGRRAAIPGYRVAGKTGTAQIVLPGDKTYAEGKWLISFAGFAPVEDPKILVVVIAEVPDLKGDYHLGGMVAAPVFKEVVSQSLSYLGVTTKAPDNKKVSSFEVTATVPDLKEMAVSAARTTLSQLGLKAEVIGGGGTVLKQVPQAGKEANLAQRVYLMTEEDDAAAVPNLVGKSLRDAMEVCSLMGLKCKAVGEGYVVKQAAGGESEMRELTLELLPAEQIAATADKPAPKAVPDPAPKKAAASQAGGQQTKR